MNNLEELCRPLILLMCRLREFRRQGVEPDMDLLLSDIHSLFTDMQTKCRDNIVLARDFSVIEKPLAFFIDYIIKESGFSFSSSWPELSRTYGELSGDEKFFDMLAQAMDDPSAMERIELYYILLGLGFSGMYKKEPDVIERKMKVCATRMPSMLDVTKEPMTLQYEGYPVAKKRRMGLLRSPKFVLAISVFFAFCSLLLNHYIFDNTTKPFQQIIDRASQETTLYIGVDNITLKGELQ